MKATTSLMYFHCTSVRAAKSIIKNGLVPKVTSLAYKMSLQGECPLVYLSKSNSLAIEVFESMREDGCKCGNWVLLKVWLPANVERYRDENCTPDAIVVEDSISPENIKIDMIENVYLDEDNCDCYAPDWLAILNNL